MKTFFSRMKQEPEKWLRAPLSADITWFLMKPPEWLFLAVLYLCDTRPEDRMQYITPVDSGSLMDDCP